MDDQAEGQMLFGVNRCALLLTTIILTMLAQCMGFQSRRFIQVLQELAAAKLLFGHFDCGSSTLHRPHLCLARRFIYSLFKRLSRFRRINNRRTISSSVLEFC